MSDIAAMQCVGLSIIIRTSSVRKFKKSSVSFSNTNQTISEAKINFERKQSFLG